jgi:glycosyltransferase involved in cell wall biosynthesis
MNMQFMCPIGYTGYGYASFNILKALYNQGITNIGLTPIGNLNVDNRQDLEFLREYIDNQFKIPYNSTTIKIWHQFDLLTRPGNGKYLAFPFFEIDILPDKDVFNLKFPDEIIVSSSWAKDILQKHNINQKIHTVPLGVDTSIFKPVPEQMNTDNYVFCTIGKWEKRKSHDVIIDCFNKAFDINDKVELWMVTHNPFLNDSQENEWLSLVQRSKLSSKIKIFPRLANHSEVASIISYSNCGLYISRGEGWNMELLETMAMNKPVIATNYSAHTEYCTNQNSILIDIDETEPAIDNKWFFGTANWAKIGQSQIDNIIEQMRNVYKNKIVENKFGLETAQRLTWQNTAEKIVSVS